PAASAELSSRLHPYRSAQYESEQVRLLAPEIFMAVPEASGKVAPADARTRLAGARKRPTPPAVSIDETAALDEARRLIEAGKFERAIPIYDVVVRKNPQNKIASAGRELCGGLRLLAGDPLAAAARIQAAVELCPP